MAQQSLLHGQKWKFPWFMRRLFLMLSTCTSMVGLSRERSHRCLHVPAMVMFWPENFALREEQQNLVVHKSRLYEGIRLHFGALSDLCLINIWHTWVTLLFGWGDSMMLCAANEIEPKWDERHEKGWAGLFLGEETFWRDVACWVDKGKFEIPSV